MLNVANDINTINVLNYTTAVKLTR